MRTTHENNPTSGRRLILIVDDELVNREILKLILQNKYDILTAPDGETALELARDNSEKLSLILLDLLMPGMHGMDVIKALKSDHVLRQIPVIVLTADKKAEVDSLHEGAADFIAKPYPDKEIILARVERTIELSEDRQIISSTERDALTGLFNREFFYRYVQLYDLHHTDTDMDAIVLDIQHFGLINERYGKSYGDDVLKRMGMQIKMLISEIGGIACRREADKFLIYCQHVDDCNYILEKTSVTLSGEEKGNLVRLRMGVYAHVDKSIEIERRFDRAKVASDSLRNNYMSSYAYYDNDLHEKEIYAERLLEDFQEAVEKKQFKVYFQPKYDVKSEVPILASAEALVRWIHPELGFISPGSFIPLFEENGLIQKLDLYVWREAAAKVREWKETYSFSVPVSVNVSRIDMYDPNLVETFGELLKEYNISASDLLLEITESAYMQDSEQIIKKVNELRNMGFFIEMDDFGTGYSSLHMISSLPIDALKLDMSFVRNAFRDGGNTKLIEVIIDIADYLSVPIIAEGVETGEQLHALRALGCDLVQGYYFSKPVPPDEYVDFLKKEKLNREDTVNAEDAEKTNSEDDKILLMHAGHINNDMAYALLSDYNEAYCVHIRTGRFVKLKKVVRFNTAVYIRDDFFTYVRSFLEKHIHKDDRERMMNFMSEDTVAKLLTQGNQSAEYRMVYDDGVSYMHMSISRTDDRECIIVCIKDMTEQIAHFGDNNTHAENISFSAIAQALAADYFSIYYVDTETDRFIEYSAHDDYDQLGIEKSGDDFFNLSRKNILRVAHPDDRDRILSAFTKENLLGEMRRNGTFTLNYRLIFGDRVNSVSMKATFLPGDNGRSIVIGVNSINAQLEREQEYDRTKKESVTFASIAQALAADYFSIYYVNTETDRFIEYSAHDDYEALGIEKEGDDFFDLSSRNILRVVHPDDTDKILSAFTKEKIMHELDKNGTFTLDYRLMLGDKVNYVSMKATKLSVEDDNHIVIGVNNINAQVQRQIEYDAARAKSDMYSRIAQALSREYYSIYLVNIETDEFIEYSSSDDFKNLHVEKNGTDFFGDCRRNALRLVHKDDLEKALAVWDKDLLMANLESGKVISVIYRIYMEEKPVYINFKVLYLSENEDSKYIVIGVSNVDEQMRRERELTEAHERANRDALTGTKSKHAYVDAVSEINIKIEMKKSEPFAVAVCDVNGLKTINDTQGHIAGDRIIKNAAGIICNIFKHSPVFRVGGDEFVVIMQGSDYEQREKLYCALEDSNLANAETGGVVIACGFSEWNETEDERFEAVFDRADNFMYENKISLKSKK